MCNLLNCMDSELIQVVLGALENVLKAGKDIQRLNNQNKTYAVLILECGGTNQIYNLKSHVNTEIYEKANEIIERYYQID